MTFKWDATTSSHCLGLCIALFLVRTWSQGTWIALSGLTASSGVGRISILPKHLTSSHLLNRMKQEGVLVFNQIQSISSGIIDVNCHRSCWPGFHLHLLAFTNLATDYLGTFFSGGEMKGNAGAWIERAHGDGVLGAGLTSLVCETNLESGFDNIWNCDTIMQYTGISWTQDWQYYPTIFCYAVLSLNSQQSGWRTGLALLEKKSLRCFLLFYILSYHEEWKSVRAREICKRHVADAA